MSDFNNILKEKLEQFEVPYNDAHWVEIERKMNKAQRLIQIKRGLFIAAGIATIFGVSSYFYSQQEKTITAQEEISIATEEVFEIAIPEEELLSKEASVPTKAEQKKNQLTANDNITEELPKVNEEAPISLEEKDPVELSPVVDELEDDKEDNKIETSQTTIETLDADFMVTNGNTCLGEEVGFEALEKRNGVSYLWDFGDGNTSAEKNPTHIYEESGPYNVSLTLINKESGKDIQKVKANSVTIYPKPVVDFKWEEIALKHDENKLKYPYTRFEVKSAEENQYRWNFGNGSVATSKKSKVLFKKKGIKKVILTIKNDFGCSAVIQKNIEIKSDFAVYAPNAFRPNGDRVETNVFIPKALLEWDIQFELSITNKLGNLVYKTTDKNHPWNGRLNNTGDVLDQGMYFWQVITYDNDGKPHQHEGTITLLEN